MTEYTSKNGTISITDEVSGGYSSESTIPCNARDRNKEFQNVLVDCLNMTKRIVELEDLAADIINAESADEKLRPMMYHVWLFKAKTLKEGV
jgi:uncharacterized membrane protein